MKSIVVSVVVVVLLLVAGVFITNNNKTLVDSGLVGVSQTPTPINEASLTPTVTSTDNSKNTNSYNLDWIIVRDPKKITLHNNSTEKLSSVDAMEKYGCAQLISGNFWREDNGEPLGLFVTDGKKEHDSMTSSLLNGYFYINKNQEFGITAAEPSMSALNIALQSGPLLYMDSKPINLTKESNDPARRVVVAKTKKGEIVFMVFYYKPSPLSGPKLEDLPELLEDLYDSSSLQVEAALNLDGGSHSAFVTDTVRITEIARIGSFFCIKP